jgi:hypothetical protein
MIGFLILFCISLLLIRLKLLQIKKYPTTLRENDDKFGIMR